MQKILHFHIPKTGGTAIRHYLAAQLGEQNVTPCIFDSRLSDALARWHEMTAISGHFTLHQGDRLPSDRASITVLRDPIDRFLSQYFFTKSDHGDRLRDAKVQALDLDDYLERLTPADFEDMSCQINMLYPLGTTDRTELSPDQKLRASIRAIESFEIVGIQRALEDFSSMLDARFSWKPGTLGFKNVTSGRLDADALSLEQRARLRRSLEGEFELYEFAKERFKKCRRDFIRRSVAMPATDRQETSAPLTPHDDTLAPLSPVEFGDGRCTVQSVEVTSEISGANRVMVGEWLTISVNFKAHEQIDELNIGIALKDERGFLVFGTNSKLLGNVYAVGPGEYAARFHLLNRAPIGRYLLDVALVRRETHYQGCYHWLEKAASFEVQETLATHFEGHVLMDADAELVPLSPEARVSLDSYMHSMHTVRSLGRNHKRLQRFASRIRPMSSVDAFHPGHDAFLSVKVENTGDEPWGAYGQQPVTLSYRWLAADGQVVVADGLRTRLPFDLAVNMSVVVPMRIRPPDAVGPFQLVLSPVQESVAWFVDEASDAGHVIQAHVA